MLYKVETEISTTDGPAFVNPAEVVMVLERDGGAEVVLTSLRRFIANEPAREIAVRLWRFENETGNGFFNAEHLLAVVPQPGGGCQAHLTGNVTLDNPISAAMFVQGLRVANAQRIAKVGEP